MKERRKVLGILTFVVLFALTINKFKISTYIGLKDHLNDIISPDNSYGGV
ncbi:hypothetical protein LCGC14_1369820 [marine sediment metagenome]|uniref:Uncharacterized protein n=1 Tax=marine sediment metagenome TaxID=412755 RepID=A0A0F9KRL7_9ZZZZ